VLAGFAEAFANPVTLGLVLALSFLLLRPAAVRLAAAAVGLTVATPGLMEAHGPLEAVQLALGAMAAGLLCAEVALHFVLPACRLARRMAAAAWRLCGEATALLLDPGPRPPPRARGRRADELQPPTPREPEP